MADYGTLAGKRVVICEDQGIVVLQVERTLARAGLSIVGRAGNGREGLEIVARERPDIVLMDIMMPEMDGIESLRGIMATCPTCVVMLTGALDRATVSKFTATGAAGYIAKPFTADSLVPALEQALAAYQSQPR